MRQVLKNLLWFLLIVALCGYAGADKTRRVLEGPYMGQKPPGKTPMMFLPGIVSTRFNEFASVFSPDGSTFLYSMSGAPYPVIVMMEQHEDRWSHPKIAPFSGRYLDYDMNFAPDGKRLFFCSKRPVMGDGPPKKDTDIWYVERSGNGWSEPVHLNYPLNSDGQEYYPVFTRSGAIYFSSTREGGMGGGDIYRSDYIRGEFTEPQNLGDAINSSEFEGDLYVDLDERYMILTCYGRPDSLGSGDLYIASRLADGGWSKLINMGPEINSSANEHCPMLSYDGKYLFFSSRRTIHSQYATVPITLRDKIKMMDAPGNGRCEDIYWVDAKIIEKLISQDLKGERDVAATDDWPVLKGPYLGQKPPGKTAEVFAPGIVSTEKNEALFGFFNSGRLFQFSRTDPDFKDWKNEPVYIMEMKDGAWTKPRLSPNIGKPWYLDLEPLPQGETLYFARWGGDRDVIDPTTLDIWEVHGTVDGWSEPRKLPPPVNSGTIDTMPTVSRDGTLYFFSGRKGGVGRDDIYRSRPVHGKHIEVENLGPAINSVHNDIDPFITPDGDCMIFCSRRPDGLGEIDLYISFQRENGSWTPAKNLGEKINSPAHDWIPFLSDDGRFLFFTSNRRGNYDIYWVDAKIIEELKPELLKQRGGSRFHHPLPQGQDMTGVQSMEKTILTLEKGAMERWRKGDPWGWTEISAEEIIYVDPGLTKPIEGLNAYKNYLKQFENKIDYQVSEFIDPTVRRYGDLAVLTYNYRDAKIKADGSIDGEWHWNTTEVYGLKKGEWKIIHTHWSYVDQKLPIKTEVPVPVASSRGRYDGVLSQVMALESTAMEQWRKGDPWGFIDICSEDVTYFDTGTAKRLNGLAALKEEYTRRIGKIHYDVMEFIDPKVQVHGDAAVLFYRFFSTYLNLDGSIARRIPWNCTEIFTKIDGQWKIVHTHWSYVNGEPR